MTPRTGLPRWAAPALLAVVLVVQFGVLRAVWNSSPHPGGDNAGYVALGHALATGQGYVELWDPGAAPHTKYPPAWPAALAVAQRLGADTWAGLKRLSGLLALTAVAATWLFVRRRRGPLWATGIALLTGSSYAFVYHAPLLLSDVPFVAAVFLALWAAEAAVGPGRGEGGEVPGDAEGGDDEAAAGSRGPDRKALWVGVAGVLAVVALLTRSAGLPVAVGLVAALAWRRRWVAAGGAALGTAIPALLWFLRGRWVDQEGAYAREFWMVDPYRPDLGEIGAVDLLSRAGTNLEGYLLEWLPRTFAGPEVGVAGALVLAVAVLAGVGWVLAVRRGPGPAEFFAVLYLGLILVWPPVWSGDRFALPLVPLILLWGGEAVTALSRRLPPKLGPAPVLVVAALLALPTGNGVLLASREAAACRSAEAVGGPWACAGLGMVQFTEAARWAGENLDDDAVVLTRKPRIWYVMSGLATRTYPFSTDPDTLLAAADRVGARYLLLDLVAGQADLIAQAIAARPGSFCSVAGFGGRDGGVRTELLGILPPALRRADAAADPQAASIGFCPDALQGGRGAALPPYTSSSPIPVLRSSP